MDTPILISRVHEAVTQSVPYDAGHIIQAFYREYQSLPAEGTVQWGEDITQQKRYMTLYHLFKFAAANIQPGLEGGAVLERLIGHIASRCKVPYDVIEEGAKAIFKK
jgi:hypothetical protein